MRNLKIRRARWRAKISRRKKGQLYIRQHRFRGCYAPTRLYEAPYPLGTAKCLYSFYHSIPRRATHFETHSAIPTPENPLRRSLNHTLFVSRRPHSAQSAQEKDVHRARKFTLLGLGVIQALKPSSPPCPYNRSFTSQSQINH